MAHAYVVIWVLSAAVALLLAVICGVTAGILHHLDGNHLPSVLMKASAAFASCLTLSIALVGLTTRMI
ncbi:MULTISPECIES: hypothetical protein [Streptomyces]|uniref:hypothetical protein n=1 Tax=Streptomyces sp. NPDC005386 TaxID=3154562 RepID=UPI0033BCA175